MDRRTNQRICRVATVALATFTFAATANAQRPTGRRTAVKEDRARTALDGRLTGLMLGVHTLAAPGVSMTGEDVDGTFQTKLGAGVGVMLGYGFNRTFSGFAQLDLAKQNSGDADYHGSFGLVHFEVGARANLPLGSEATVPYVRASVGRRALGARVYDDWEEAEHDMSLSGGMFGVGGGIQRFISPSLALDGGVDLGFGRFTNFDEAGEQSNIDVNGSTSIRLRFGVTWRPGARRSS